jgi:hypothetical protein
MRDHRENRPWLRFVSFIASVVLMPSFSVACQWDQNYNFPVWAGLRSKVGYSPFTLQGTSGLSTTDVLEKLALARMYRVCAFKRSYELEVLTGPDPQHLTKAAVLPTFSCMDVESRTVAVRYVCEFYAGPCANRPALYEYCRDTNTKQIVQTSPPIWAAGWAIPDDDYRTHAPDFPAWFRPNDANESIVREVPIYVGSTPRLYVVNNTLNGMIAIVDGVSQSLRAGYDNELYGRRIFVSMGTWPLPGNAYYVIAYEER